VDGEMLSLDSAGTYYRSRTGTANPRNGETEAKVIENE
jgi:hypothetical protein